MGALCEGDVGTLVRMVLRTPAWTIADGGFGLTLSKRNGALYGNS